MQNFKIAKVPEKSNPIVFLYLLVQFFILNHNIMVFPSNLFIKLQYLKKNGGWWQSNIHKIKFFPFINASQQKINQYSYLNTVIMLNRTNWWYFKENFNGGITSPSLGNSYLCRLWKFLIIYVFFLSYWHLVRKAVFFWIHRHNIVMNNLYRLIYFLTFYVI